MKKKKKINAFIAAMIAVVTMASVGVGASIAAWVSTASRQTIVEPIDPEVAVGIELNDDFKLYNASTDAEVESLYLICDAPENDPNYLPGDGVYWAIDAAGANPITTVYMKGTLSKENHDGVKDKNTVTVQFGASHNLSSNYITFGSMTAPANLVVTVADGAEVESADFALPTVSYSNVPAINELSTMRAALATELSSAALSLSAQIIA